MASTYIKPERLWLKTHLDYSEKRVQVRTADDPSILRFGDLVLRDQKRVQPRAGRLDLLLQDPDTQLRYGLKLQLGTTDEAQIIRNIEYWNIEQKCSSKYSHCAVLVAEYITSRFLNVVSLFNGAIPLIAIQLQTLKVGDAVTFVFTIIIGELTRGLVDEDEYAVATIPTNRVYLEKKASKQTVALVDEILIFFQFFDGRLALKYNKFHVFIQGEGQTLNFVQIRPRRRHLIMQTHFHLRLTGFDFMKKSFARRSMPSVSSIYQLNRAQ